MKKHLMKSTLILGLLIAACLVPVTGFSAWQPQRPVQYIIPWAAGGGSDIIARQVVSVIESEKLAPQPFIVENKVGGNAMVALNYLMGKKADPHVLMFATWTNLAVPLLEKIPFSLKDTTPIARYLLDEQMMWVPWNSPYKTLKMVSRAAAGLAEAKIYLGFTRIVSPVTGIVTEKKIEVGGMAVPGMPLLAVESRAAFHLHGCPEKDPSPSFRLQHTENPPPLLSV